ncbi:hypothetical protein [Maribacter polysaccharolyticus]|uniref:hypothetical protein n=1 Tax=Maribacter polysaccharolyticus TaxID=3020831 RepID=UPI00237FB068|nr:hypothetical protein [Maribacter polysaccharolyticus]MDE3742307.1 hypothetical protein [Maribacter polysaccharolyticus]
MGKSIFLLVLVAIFTCSSCKRSKQGKSDIDIEFTQDTLEIGYTYWWAESGPFLSPCGEELSLAFSGTITDILPPTDAAGPLYLSQKGIIKIEEVYKIKDLGPNTYANQQFFVSDCFDGLDLKKDDQVLVFCYDYENALSLPGGTSILKIRSLRDPLVTSFKKYIDSDQNPLKIKNDIKLWEKTGLGENLRKIIACKMVPDNY